MAGVDSGDVGVDGYDGNACLLSLGNGGVERLAVDRLEDYSIVLLSYALLNGVVLS
jgi:hypothetical protein